MFTHNTPAQLQASLAAHRSAGLFSEYPFGTDLTTEEINLASALKHLQSRTTGLSGKWRTFAAALLHWRSCEAHTPSLRRLGLDRPKGLGERMLRRLVSLALKESARSG